MSAASISAWPGPAGASTTNRGRRPTRLVKIPSFDPSDSYSSSAAGTTVYSVPLSPTAPALPPLPALPPIDTSPLSLHRTLPLREEAVSKIVPQTAHTATTTTTTTSTYLSSATTPTSPYSTVSGGSPRFVNRKSRQIAPPPPPAVSPAPTPTSLAPIPTPISDTFTTSKAYTTGAVMGPPSPEHSLLAMSSTSSVSSDANSHSSIAGAHLFSTSSPPIALSVPPSLSGTAPGSASGTQPQTSTSAAATSSSSYGDSRNIKKLGINTASISAPISIDRDAMSARSASGASASGLMSPESPPSRWNQKLPQWSNLGPVASHASSTAPTVGTGSGSVTGKKLFNQLSTSVKSTLTPQSATLPAAISLQTAANAKFFTDPEVKSKMRLLTLSESRFDEVIEFGFPIGIDLEPPTTRRGSKATVASEPAGRLDDGSGLSTDLIPPRGGSSSVHSDNGGRGGSTTALGSPSSPMSESGMSPTSRHLQNINAVPREMTLKFTLSPPSMRADEELIYGWQRDHIDTGTVRSIKSLGAVDEESLNSPAAIDSSLLGRGTGSNNHSNSASDVFIGLGSKKPIAVKRVWGKFRKQKTVPTAATMITSADMD